MGNNESNSSSSNPDQSKEPAYGIGGGADDRPVDIVPEAAPDLPPISTTDNPFTSRPKNDPETLKEPEADINNTAYLDNLFASFDKIATDDSTSFYAINDEELLMLEKKHRRLGVPHLSPTTKGTESWDIRRTPSQFIDCHHPSFAESPGGTVQLGGCGENVGDLTGLMKTIEKYDMGNTRVLDYEGGTDYARWAMVNSSSEAVVNSPDASALNNRKRKATEQLPYPLSPTRFHLSSSDRRHSDLVSPPRKDFPISYENPSPSTTSSLERLDSENQELLAKKESDSASTSNTRMNSSLTSSTTSGQRRSQKRHQEASPEGGSPAKKLFTPTLRASNPVRRLPNLDLSPVRSSTSPSGPALRTPSSPHVTPNLDSSLETSITYTNYTNLLTARESSTMTVLPAVLPPQILPQPLPPGQQARLPVPLLSMAMIPPVLPQLESNQPAPVPLPLTPTVAAVRSEPYLKRKIEVSLDALDRCLNRVAGDGFNRNHTVLDFVNKIHRLKSTLRRLEKEVEIARNPNPNANSRRMRKDPSTINKEFAQAHKRVLRIIGEVKRHK